MILIQFSEFFNETSDFNSAKLYSFPLKGAHPYIDMLSYTRCIWQQNDTTAKR